jgi:hypothetical protein
MIVASLQIAATIRSLEVVDRIERNPGSMSLDELEAIDRRADVLWVIAVILGFATVVLLAVVVKRLYCNVATYSTYPLRFSPGWAAGAWFVPFLNLVRPKQIVDDVWRGTEREQPAWWAPTRPAVSGLLHIWWAVLVLALVTSRAGRTGDPADSDELRDLYWQFIAGSVTRVVALSLTAVVAFRLLQRDRLRHAQASGAESRRPSRVHWAIIGGAFVAVGTAFTVGLVVFAPDEPSLEASAAGEEERADRTSRDAEFDTSCDALGSVLADLGDSASVSRIAEHFETALSELRVAATRADGQQRVDLEAVRLVYQELQPVYVALAADLEDFDPSSKTDALEFLAATPGFLQSGFMEAPAVDLVIECDLDILGLQATDDLERFAVAADAFLQTRAAAVPAYDPLRELVEAMWATGERMDGVASSIYVDEFARCQRAIGASRLGDDDGCDTLHRACDSGDLDACNDLYWTSQVGSGYEEFAATCGRRTAFGRIGYAGFCDELDD